MGPVKNRAHLINRRERPEARKEAGSVLQSAEDFRPTIPGAQQVYEMRSGRVARWAGRALFLAFAMALAVIGASCRAVFGINGYEDSVAVLCELLDRCYEGGSGECQARIHDKLVSGSVDPWEQWLSDLGDFQCLESCGAARRCLDLNILCDLGACATDEDCCGFLSGRSVCKPGKDPEVKACCAPVGAECGPQLACCEGMGPCNEVTGTCGGVICRQAGAFCANSFECCSDICRDSFCAEEVCEANGFPCDRHDECCSEFCDPATSACSTPSCGLIGKPCSDASPCCEVDGSVCFIPEGAVTGICSTCEDKLPNEEDCGYDDQCCSGYCAPLVFECANRCGAVGDACGQHEDCCDGFCQNGQCALNSCGFGACGAPAECCSGKCVVGQCGPSCKIPTGCLHNVCTPGAPLSAVDGGCPPEKGQACIAQVCNDDDFCCCTAWDSICVLATKDKPACAGLCGAGAP
jgi:hypothetical protein